jgi:hypothetical protein
MIFVWSLIDKGGLFTFRWKDLSNVYRQSPWNVSAIPTIIKVGKDGNVSFFSSYRYRR